MAGQFGRVSRLLSRNDFAEVRDHALIGLTQDAKVVQGTMFWPYYAGLRDKPSDALHAAFAAVGILEAGAPVTTRAKVIRYLDLFVEGNKVRKFTKANEYPSNMAAYVDVPATPWDVAGVLFAYCLAGERARAAALFEENREIFNGKMTIREKGQALMAAAECEL
jgi:hypothetical protein